ncbi:hypothetical protein [Occallatibacter savannae]|uniref:hypothetical protein n=1 Tax=Occallatibacter savannae TaxID=1002691 RepID=UPI000D69836D|nr:hypothetical protein [Occallatibacter savannae]
METDAQTTFEEYTKDFSEADWDYAEALAYLAHALCRGLSEDDEFEFVRAGLDRKRAHPIPDPPAFEILNAGLIAIGKPPITRTTKRRKARGKLSGTGA